MPRTSSSEVRPAAGPSAAACAVPGRAGAAWQSLVLVLALGATAEVLARDTEATLFFSAGWRPAGDPAGNVVELGVVYPCGPGLCVDTEVFDGRRNLPVTAVAPRHEMHARTRSATCSDRALATVEGDLLASEPARVSDTAEGLEVVTARGRYQWARTGQAGAGVAHFELRAVRERGQPEDAAQAVGSAVSVARPGTPSGLSGLAQRYEGVIHHKDMNTGPADPWSDRRSSLALWRFQPNQGDASVLGFTGEGQSAVNRRLRRPVQAHHSIALLPPRSTRLRYLLHDYGHDFNGNGCFDEPGHNKLMLPVVVDSRITDLVYIEYTPDNRRLGDRVPMLSVGSYATSETATSDPD